MLAGYLGKRPLKRTLTAQPFVDDYAQGVLITGRNSSTLQLFRCHIRNSASYLLPTLLVARTLGNDSNTKITEQDIVAAPQQHVLRLDVSMNNPLIMCILQGGGDLLDIG